MNCKYFFVLPCNVNARVLYYGVYGVPRYINTVVDWLTRGFVPVPVHTTLVTGAGSQVTGTV
jgi:hypothetical protein